MEMIDIATATVLFSIAILVLAVAAGIVFALFWG